MKTISILGLIPLLVAGCPHFSLSENKILYITPGDQLLQVTEETHEKLYIVIHVDLKALGCLAKSMNVSLEVDGLPDFTKEEVVVLCNIPDHCFPIKTDEKIFDNKPINITV